MASLAVSVLRQESQCVWRRSMATSPEEEEAPHLPDAPPARILKHVDHIELMLDVMGLDGLFRNNPSSHWMRCLTTKFRHLAKKLHPDKPGGSAAQMEELKYAYDYLQGIVQHIHCRCAKGA